MRSSMVLAALLAALAAAPALAQPSAPDGAGPPHAGADGQRRDGADHWRDGMERRREGMARAMKAVLQLRPDQEQAFAAFQAAVTRHGPGDRKGPGDRRDPDGRRGPGGGEGDALTTPQRLDRGLERMQARLEQARARAAAVKTFYAALSPEQQRAFDALARLHGPMGRGGGRMAGALGGPMGPGGFRPGGGDGGRRTGEGF